MDSTSDIAVTTRAGDLCSVPGLHQIRPYAVSH
jgi:hypothetical protein